MSINVLHTHPPSDSIQITGVVEAFGWSWLACCAMLATCPASSGLQPRAVIKENQTCMMFSENFYSKYNNMQRFPTLEPG